MAENNFNKISKLYIETKKGTEKDYISDLKFTAPFKVNKAFYDENNNMSIMTMSVSAGIMAGDTQEIEIFVGENSKTKIFSQSFEKIHKMNEGFAQRKTKLKVSSGGFLDYSPLPTIPFANSAFKNKTDIYLTDKSSKLVYSEILSCGRAGRGEIFEYKYYKSLTSIFMDDELLYYDNANYEPSQIDMNGYCMFEGFTHQSNLILMNIEVEIDDINEIIKKYKEVDGGCSVSHCGAICVRALSTQADILQVLNKEIVNLI